MFSKASHAIIRGVEDTTGFARVKFPLMYLGCPIDLARKRKYHFV